MTTVSAPSSISSGRLRRLLEPAQDVVAQRHRVLEVLERVGVLLDAGDAVRGGDGAGAEHEAVEADRADAGDVQLVRLEVGAAHPAEHDVDVALAVEDAPRTG